MEHPVQIPKINYLDRLSLLESIKLSLQMPEAVMKCHQLLTLRVRKNCNIMHEHIFYCASRHFSDERHVHVCTFPDKEGRAGKKINSLHDNDSPIGTA